MIKRSSLIIVLSFALLTVGIASLGTPVANADCRSISQASGCKANGYLCSRSSTDYSCDNLGNVNIYNPANGCPTSGNGQFPQQDFSDGANIYQCGHSECFTYPVICSAKSGVTVSLTGPSQINLGSPATLVWSSTGATTCTASSSPTQPDWNTATPISTSSIGYNVNPNATGTVTYFITCRTGLSSAVDFADVDVAQQNAGGPGVITVISEVSSTHVAVPASWTFTSIGGSPDPCFFQGNNCTNVSTGNYSNLAADTYQINPTVSKGYSLNSIHQGLVAEKPRNAFEAVLAFGKQLFAFIAHAVSYGGNGPVQPTPPQANFVVWWDPVAILGASPTAVSLTGNAPVYNLSLLDAGSPGSYIDTLSAVASPAAPWLTIGTLPASITTTAPQGVLLTANTTTGLCTTPPGCTTKITFAGLGWPGFIGTHVVSTSVSVTFLNQAFTGYVCVSNACTPSNSTTTSQQQCNASCGGAPPPPPPSCSLSANPTMVIIPQTTNLTYGCINVNSCSMNGGQFSNYFIPIQGNIASGILPASPTASTTYTISCNGNSASASTSVQVSVTNPNLIETHP